ncbi:major facilitator superfamily transporter [Xylona heveae TC161]|uniref:Major facilitator superfamily transporter n=1 Tax=Xylona heveae (strain CBS 132557 / TC161) TaxID=1328760 RepID=A0A165AIC0_XYLHT|nr:major facilitator superfamily transporter [Xylona heveae TC161]KZF20525.1 major facilitator superfamily transporter [Xylona heveae TC161]
MAEKEPQQTDSLPDEAPPPISEKPVDSQDVFPEGGRKAWLTVAGASACLFVSFGWVNCVGVFQDYYQTHQLRNYSPSQIAWIPALQIFFMLFSGTFVGKVFDDYGPAYLLFIGTFLHVFGLMMTSISKKYYQILLSQAVCSAIGASMVFTPAFTSVTTWFRAKRGAALGLVVAGSSLGGVIFPVMLIHLLPEVGFGWAMRICAFLILALLIFANLTVRSRIAPTKRPFQLMAFVRPLREPSFSLLTASIFFFFWGMFIPFTFIVEGARSHGMSPRLSNYLVPILNGASVIGRTVPNIIADKVGHFNVMIVMSTFTSILILALWLPATGNTPIILFAALFGIGSGAGIGLTPALCAHVSPIKEIGVRTGTVFTFSAIAALTGSPIGGQIIIVSHGSFKDAAIFGGVSCAIGAALVFATRVCLAGFKKTKI